jgi:hypothetical protein
VKYKKVQNDEQVYQQLKNMKQEKNEIMEIYYDKLLKLVDNLQHKQQIVLNYCFQIWITTIFACSNNNSEERTFATT